MQSPLSALFDTMARRGILYCVLRDAERLDTLAHGGEIDLLVHPSDLDRAEACLAESGFVGLVSWGHWPHHFYVLYDAVADCWIKCDVVTAISYGRPVHNLVTDLANDCLAERHRAGRVFAPCPEDELVTLLLHCVLDSNAFRPERVARVKELRRQTTRDERLQAHVSRYWPGMTWPRLAKMIDRDEWPLLQGRREQLSAHLRRGDYVGTTARGVRDRALRQLRRWIGMARPSAPSVALLAPDGAGKSTLVSGIRDRFFGPVHSVYMGLQQGKSRQWARSRVPGLGLSRHLFSQWRRYLSARYRQAGGQLVLFDRYTYDALLPATGGPGPLRRLRRWLLAHACPAPDLVVLLDVPGEELFARKGEHDAVFLEQQRQCYLRMRPHLRRATVIDGSCDPGHLRRQVTTLLWEEYRSRGLR